MKPSLVCLCAALVITVSRSSLAADVLYDVDDLAMTSVHVTGNRRGVTLEAPIDGSSLLLVAGAFFTGAGLLSAQGGLGGDVGAAFLALVGAAHAAPGVGLLVPGAILWASGSSRVDVGEPQQVGLRFTMGGAKLVF